MSGNCSTEVWCLFWGFWFVVFLSLTHLECFWGFYFFLYLWQDDTCPFFFVDMMGSHVSSAGGKLHLHHREHTLKISWVSYLRSGYEKISISCWWPLFIHRPLNTSVYELIGFKSMLSLIYGEIEFFVRLLLLGCFQWDVFSLARERHALSSACQGHKSFLRKCKSATLL